MKLLLIASLILNCTSALKFFNFIKINTGKNAWKNSIAATFIAVGICGQSVNAFGPVEVSLSNLKYKQVELCDGKKPIMPGQKAAQGLFPVCIEVDADATNPGKDSLKDVSVYGFIKDNYAGNSVLPNNPDFKSDAGQYAMIKSVPPGESRVTFQFVAAVVTDPKVTPISDTSLTFFKTKAVSFPGGDRFKALDVCDVDPSSDGCASDDEPSYER